MTAAPRWGLAVLVLSAGMVHTLPWISSQRMPRTSLERVAVKASIQMAALVDQNAPLASIVARAVGTSLAGSESKWPPLPMWRGSTPARASPAGLVAMWFAATAHLNAIDSRWRSLRPSSSFVVHTGLSTATMSAVLTWSTRRSTMEAAWLCTEDRQALAMCGNVGSRHAGPRTVR